MEIGIGIEENEGFTVHNVVNVLHKTTKNIIPILFYDIDPAAINQDIFHIKYLLNIKIKIEVPYKKRTVIQCTISHKYGHSKSYYAYIPRRVKCVWYKVLLNKLKQFIPAP